MTVDDDIRQLQQQQSLLTDGLKRMITGEWTGFPSLEADLGALSPGITLDPHPPLLTSEAGPPPQPSWWDAFEPNTSMPGQVNSWSCSACSLAWVLRATELDPSASEQSMIEAIGCPENINPTYGLMNGDGRELRRVLFDYGVDSGQGWLTFDQAYAIYRDTTGMLSGGAWYHWCAIRGLDNGYLWIANSAPGYKGVYDVLNRYDFERLGPMSCVWLLH